MTRFFHALLMAAVCGGAAAQDRSKFLITRDSSADQGEIRILDALYGQDDRICRAQDAVARQCDGRSRCEILADDQLCGNPYANVAKQLFVGYSCGNDRRSVTVDEGQVAYVYCLDQGQPVSDAGGGESARDNTARPPADWRRSRVYVSRAVYGAGNRVCDATSALGYECDGQRSCRFEAGNNLCGDPARGIRKESLVEYWCNGTLEEARFEEGEDAELNCN